MYSSENEIKPKNGFQVTKTTAREHLHAEIVNKARRHERRRENGKPKNNGKPNATLYGENSQQNGKTTAPALFTRRDGKTAESLKDGATVKA